MPSSQPENKPPTCDRVFGSGAHTVKNIDGVACCTVCDIPCADHIQEVEPENQLDNDKEELKQSILTEFKQVYKLAPANYTENCTNVVMSLVDQYTQSKLKAFAGEVEALLEYEDVERWSDPVDRQVAEECNQLKSNILKALKAIKEKYQL